MARSRFGGGVGDQVFEEIPLGPSRTVYGKPASSVTLTIWADEAATVPLTDLLAADGVTPITEVVVPPGGVVDFYGPDGVNDELWAKDPDGDMYRLSVGPAGPVGPAGGTDAATAEWVGTGALTGPAVDTRVSDKVSADVADGGTAIGGAVETKVAADVADEGTVIGASVDGRIVDKVSTDAAASGSAIGAALTARGLTRRTPADSFRAWGHSYVEGVSNAGTLLDAGMSPVAAELLGLPLRNEAIGGTVLYNYVGGGASWQHVLRKDTRPARFTPPTGLHVSLYGMNDLDSLGNTLAEMQPFLMAQRVAVSRWRAGRVFENTDAAWVFGGSGTWLTDSSGANSGGSSRYNTTNGATAAFTTPVDFPGGTLALGFIAWNDAGGAVFTTTVNSIVYTHDTRTWSKATTKTCSVLRIPNVPAGAQTITLTVSDATGAAGAMVDYAQWESPEDAGPLVALVKQPQPTDLSPYGGDVTAAGIDVMNDAFDTLAAEFGGEKVITIDTSIMDGDATLFATGNVHPTAKGHRVLGTIIANALRDLIDPTLAVPWAAPRQEYATAPPTGTDRNYRVGDRVINTDPFATAVPGWVCTVAGAPGTWASMAGLDTNVAPRITYGTAVPTTGAHLKGDFHVYTSGTAGGTLMWVCTVSGTPGTWALTNLRQIVGEGQSVLSAGSVAVANASITSSSQILMWRAGAGTGTQGVIYHEQTAGVGFTIKSTEATDNATVQWQVIKY